MPQEFENWQIPGTSASRLNLVRLDQTDGRITLVLKSVLGRPCEVKITFDAPIAYRNVNETYRYRTWLRHDMKGRPTLHLVQNSDWIVWLKGESGGLLDDHRLVHYMVITDEDCIDVASEFPPEVNVRDLTKI